MPAPIIPQAKSQVHVQLHTKGTCCTLESPLKAFLENAITSKIIDSLNFSPSREIYPLVSLTFATFFFHTKSKKTAFSFYRCDMYCRCFQNFERSCEVMFLFIRAG